MKKTNIREEICRQDLQIIDILLFSVKRFVMPAWMTLGKKRARLALQGLWGCWWRETGPRPRLWPVGGGCGLCPTVMLELFLVVLLPASPSGVTTACTGLLLLLPPLLFTPEVMGSERTGPARTRGGSIHSAGISPVSIDFARSWMSTPMLVESSSSKFAAIWPSL